MAHEAYTVLFPGTFDPITNGHIDLVARAARLYSYVVVAVAESPRKGPTFDLDTRVQLATKALAQYDNVSVEGFDILLADFAQQKKAKAVIRGLRAVSDFEYEFQMTGMNYQINPNIETVFLMADPRYQTIASRLVKEVARYGGNITSFVPELVGKEVREKVSAAKK